MEKPITRRSFISKTASFCGISIVSNAVIAQAMVNENSPQAMALGYKSHVSTVNINKYPSFSANQRCETCALFQVKHGASSGGCPLFPGNQVYAFGWCSAYAKRASPHEPSQSSEITNLQPIAIQNVSNPQSDIATKEQSNQSERLSLEVSKQKCEELGFKPATEAFGKCVLQLTK